MIKRIIKEDLTPEMIQGIILFGNACVAAYNLHVCVWIKKKFMV